MQQTLRHWQQDSDLAGIRDADGPGQTAGRGTRGVREALGRRGGAAEEGGDSCAEAGPALNEAHDSKDGLCNASGWEGWEGR